jgi:hypothetical protein
LVHPAATALFSANPRSINNCLLITFEFAKACLRCIAVSMWDTCCARVAMIATQPDNMIPTTTIIINEAAISAPR